MSPLKRRRLPSIVPGFDTISSDVLFNIYNELDTQALKQLQTSYLSKNIHTSLKDYWRHKVLFDFGVRDGTEALHIFLRIYTTSQLALVSAIQSKSTERYAELISASGFGNSSDLIQACLFERVTVVENLLYNPLVNPAIDDNYCIKFASNLGNAKIVKMLLDTGRVNPAAEDNYALIFASRMGRVEVVSLLLGTKKVDCKAQNGMALTLAKARGNTQVVQLLEANC